MSSAGRKEEWMYQVLLAYLSLNKRALSHVYTNKTLIFIQLVQGHHMYYNYCLITV